MYWWGKLHRNEGYSAATPKWRTFFYESRSTRCNRCDYIWHHFIFCSFWDNFQETPYLSVFTLKQYAVRKSIRDCWLYNSRIQDIEHKWSMHHGHFPTEDDLCPLNSCSDHRIGFVQKFNGFLFLRLHLGSCRMDPPCFVVGTTRKQGWTVFRISYLMEIEIPFRRGQEAPDNIDERKKASTEGNYAWHCVKNVRLDTIKKLLPFPKGVACTPQFKAVAWAVIVNWKAQRPHTLNLWRTLLFF